jgi:hypothetical protein
VLQYHTKKKWGLKCDTCNFRIGCLEGAGMAHRQPEQCQECLSHLIAAQYKDNSPFPNGAKSRTACILCDAAMRSTIVNFFFKQVKSKTPQEIEEEQHRREERQKLKEAKKAS